MIKFIYLVEVYGTVEFLYLLQNSFLFRLSDLLLFLKVFLELYEHWFLKWFDPLYEILPDSQSF